MAIPVLIMGRSGSGKTYSIKNFTPEEVGVISVEKGRLPFKSKIQVARIPNDFTDTKTSADLNRKKYAWLEMSIKTAQRKAIVIDDSQYLLGDVRLVDNRDYAKVNYYNVRPNYFPNKPYDETASKIVYVIKHENMSEELRHVWLCHLSEENNHPELARKTVESVLRSYGIIFIWLVSSLLLSG